MRELLEKGPKYRERRALDWGQVVKEVEDTLSKLVKEWSSKEGCVEEELRGWRERVMEEVKEKVERLKKEVPADPGNEVLTVGEVLRALEELQASYVLTSGDKSEGNIIIVCMRHYVQRVRAEILGLGREEKTYEEQKESKEEIVERQVKEIEELGFVVEEKHRKIASLYYTAKMHKDPPAERYIMAGSKCTMKVVSKFLSKCLKLVQAEVKLKCVREYREVGSSKFRKFWVVDSTKEPLVGVARVNTRRSAKDVSSFDFSTLYTVLKHESLKQELKWVIEEAFEEAQVTRGVSKMAVYAKEAKWVKDEREGTRVVTKDELVRLMEYCIDNALVAYGERVFRQRIGLPMGTDCAPFMANLYLFALEYKWATKMEGTEEGRKVLKGIGGFYRYIDDLLCLNATEVMKRYKEEIYPGLVLKKENEHDHTSHFLDFRVVINKGQLRSSLYDKRDDFPFEVRSFPNLTGNVHIARAHGVVIGQAARFVRSCDHYTDFTERIKDLTARLIAQSFSSELLGKKLRVFYEENSGLLAKYSVSRDEFVQGSFRGGLTKAAKKFVKRIKRKKKKKKTTEAENV